MADQTMTVTPHSTQQKTYLGQTKATWYIYWICAVASIANVFQGFDSGIYSIIISDIRFIDYFDVSGARAGVVASMVNLGNVLGNLFVAWWFIWYLGRRYAFVLGTIILLVGVALQAGAVVFSMIIVGRIIAGVAEVSSPLIRGRVVSFVQLSYQVGVLISYCVGLGTVKIPGNNSWRTATALQVIPGAVLIVAAFGLPESPRWLLERYPHRTDRVLKTLAKLRKLPEDDETVVEEFNELVAAHQYNLENEGNYTWREFLGKYVMWKRIGFGMATMALGQLSGVGALMLYGVLIFEGLGFSSGTMSLLLNVVSGVLCLAATCVITGGVDKWGRKITLIVGSAIMVVSYIIIGALADVYPTATNFNNGAAIVQVIFIYVIEMAYSGALGPCAWIYASEIFPTNVRDKGINISQAGQQITTLWINQAWPVMFDNVGHRAYYILVGINLLGLIVVVLFWPETKGISLEKMDVLFEGVDKVNAYQSQHADEKVIEATLETTHHK
ncbi:MFS sugar transporter [Venustampulla echinocandica]|uniref:MFS sugar transporter n=1 Tax=Venustampulla echinocandica TaxID=2656787 RepID=A0A370TLK6_9HELO|nr:MFS sugar transporter [Venustampulla echinocandica]RDL36404.1 MFS sugar transporter [Venustampulla echinocandica]